MGAQTPDRLRQFEKRFVDWDDPTGELLFVLCDTLHVCDLFFSHAMYFGISREVGESFSYCNPGLQPRLLFTDRYNIFAPKSRQQVLAIITLV